MHELLGGFFKTLLVADNGATGLAQFSCQPVHLVIADLRMPVMDGMVMAAEIRKLDAKIPILVTSAYAETDDLLGAVRLHFTDYLIKPTSWDKLKAALEKCAEQILESGRFFIQLSAEAWFSPLSEKLLRQGDEVTLTTKEKTLLNLLVGERGQVVSKERIFQIVYPGEEGATDSALKNLVLKLRRKIGEDVIVNRYGAGYMLRPYGQQ